MLCPLLELSLCFRVRSEGVGRLAWFLTHETESARKFPSFSELDVTNLTHLLIVDSPKALADKERGRSVFQVHYFNYDSLYLILEVSKHFY